MPFLSYPRRFSATTLLALCGACNSGGGDADATDDADEPALDASLIDREGADGAVIELDAQVPDTAMVDAAVDAGPPPNALRPGWCTRTRTVNENVGVTTRTYDMRDRVVEEVTIEPGGDAERFTMTYEWDDADRLIRKIGRRDGENHRFPDETFTYSADGLLREATYRKPEAMQVVRQVLSSANGRYTGLRTYVNDAPIETYKTLEWDADGRLSALNHHLSTTDEIYGFEHYTYKERNPGRGKLERDERDQDSDGLVDSRTTYRYEQLMGVLESIARQRVDVRGNVVGEPWLSSWDHLFLTGFHQVESYSSSGAVRETYRHLGDTVEVTEDECEIRLYEGRIVEFQEPGGLTGFTPEAGGNPNFVGAQAGFRASGRLLRWTECDGEVLYELIRDEVGNVISEKSGSSLSTFTYECWE